MSKEFVISAESLTTIKVDKDDVILVTLPEDGFPSEEEICRMREQVSSLLDGAKVVVVPFGMSINKMEPASLSKTLNAVISEFARCMHHSLTINPCATYAEVERYGNIVNEVRDSLLKSFGVGAEIASEPQEESKPIQFREFL